MEVRRKTEEENKRVQGAVHTLLGARQWNEATGMLREPHPLAPRPSEESESVSHSVVPDSLQPHGLQ